MSLFDAMKVRFIFVFLVIASISACVKGPSYPIEPVIKFKSVSSNYIKSGSVDTLTFTFTDGDGDIGINPSPGDTCNQCAFKDGDSSCLRMTGFNVIMIDSRDSCVSYYASANVEPTGKFKGIAGEILVIRAIDSKKCFAVPSPGCPKDTVIYTIILRDKAYHFSNAIQADPIVVDGE